MKQLQFYKYATWALLFLNFSMVAFFFLIAPPPPQGAGNGGGRAVDMMKLDEQQDEAFLQFRSQHIQLMDDFNTQQRNLLKPYFNSLTDSGNTNNSDSLLLHVQLLERKKIESTYQHFQDVKSILRPEQYSGFEEFIAHAKRKILLEEKKNPRPPNDF